MENFKPKVRVCENKVLQILTPNDPAQLQMFGTTKYRVKNLRYDKVWRSKDYIKVQQDEKLGLFNKKAEQILPIKFDNVQIYERGFICTEDNISFFYNLDGSKRIYPGACVEMYFPKHKMVLLCRLGMVNPFILAHEDGGLINHKSFDFYIDLPDKLLLCSGVDQRRLMYNKKTGEISWVWSVTYRLENKDSEAIVYKTKGKEGLILRTGSCYKEIIKPKAYKKIEVCKLKKEKSYGLDLPYRIKVSRNNKTGVVDWKGKAFIPCVYDEIYEYANLGIFVVKNGKKGLITHKKVLSCRYDKIEKATRVDGEERFFVCKNDLWGVAGDSGVDKFLIPIKYSSVSEERSKFYYVVGYGIEIGEKCGFCDLNGRQVLFPQYDSVDVIKQSSESKVFLKLIMFGEDKRKGIATLDGKIIIPVAYKKVDLRGSEFIVQSDLGCGLFSVDGKKLLPDKYDSIEQITTNFYRVGLDGKYGAYFAKRQKMVIPIEYSWVDIDKHRYLFGQVRFMSTSV